MAFKNHYNKFGFDKDGFNSAGYDKMGYNREGYDRQGFNRSGYNKNGIHKLTGRDLEGYDAEGFDEAGFDRNGFDKEGYNTEGFNKLGYNREGYDAEGYNSAGYDRDGFNKRGFDSDGFDREGYSSQGYNRDGYNREGYDLSGYNSDGFDKKGYDRDGYGRDGFNSKGIDREGYNREGFDSSGFNRNGRDKYGFDHEGKDINGFNIYGWSENGINYLGYDKTGFDKNGLSIEGYTRDQFDEEGFNKLTGFNLQGFDKDGFNINNIDAAGYDRDGYHSITGLNRNGYRRDGYDKNGYDNDGYDKNGFNIEGYNRQGYNRAGYDKHGYDRRGFNFDGYDKRGFDIFGYNKDGKLDPDRKESDTTTFKSNDARMEEQYLRKCITAIQHQKEEEFNKRQKEQYPEIIRYWYNDCELQKTTVYCPGIDQLQGIMNRNYAERLSTPYMARVSYKDNPELYLGKKAVYGWVVDWADKRAAYYYQYDIYIGNEDVGLELVRDFDIKYGMLLGYSDLYNRETIDTSDTDAHYQAARIADERLAKIIEANKQSKHIHDIIESIQQNQYKIISTDKDDDIVVIGCAGSGKSMILMHRIRFIKYNHNDLDLGNFIVISPTNILKNESKLLSEILEISNVHQYDTIQFYLNCIYEYFDRGSYVFEPLHIRSYSDVDASKYETEHLNHLTSSLRSICINGPEKSKFQIVESSKIEREKKRKRSVLGVNQVTFQSIVSCYETEKKTLAQCSKTSIEQYIEDISTQVAERDQELAICDLIQLLLEKGMLLDNSPNRVHKVENINDVLFYTRSIVSRLDVAGVIDAFLAKGSNIISVKDFVTVMQLYANPPLDKNSFYHLIHELESLSCEDAIKCGQFLEKDIERLDRLSYKVSALWEALQKEIPNGNNSKRLSDTSFDKLTELYINYSETLMNNGGDFWEYFDSCECLQKREKALEQDKSEKNGNHYLFYKLLHVLDISEDHLELCQEEIFEMLYMINFRIQALSKSEKYFYIDEFQDLAPNELSLIHQMFPRAHFDLFGDPFQCVHRKGIKKISEIPPMKNWKTFEIHENYRNAREITQYVNHKMNTSMRPVGLHGIQKESHSIPKLKIEKDDRIAIIVLDENNIGVDYVEEFDILNVNH